jgi:hypothetical protein
MYGTETLDIQTEIWMLNTSNGYDTFEKHHTENAKK